MLPSRARKFLLPAVGVLVAAGAAGAALCWSGPRLHPIHGTLLHRGVPADGAVIVFHPVGGDPRARRPNARVAPDGSFALATADRLGAVKGEYVITVIWPGSPPPPDGRDPLARFTRPLEAKPDRLHGRYAGQTTSALTARVVGPIVLPPIDLP